MQVWLRPQPRALILINEDDGTRAAESALVVSVSDVSNPFAGRHNDAEGSTSASASSSSQAARALVQMMPVDEIDFHAHICLTESTGSAAGCLGLINVGNDLFLCIVTRAKEVGPVRPDEMVMAIEGVAFFCVNRATWDGLDAPEGQSTAGIGANPSASNSSSSLDPYDAMLPQTPAAAANAAIAMGEHPCASLKRLLTLGSFYYAAAGSFDISTRLDRRVGKNAKKHDISQYDGRFVWNTYMIEPLMEHRARLDQAERDRLDDEGFFLLAIQGFVAVFDMSKPVLSHTQDATKRQATTSIALISRLSWKRAGTRFNTRGVDDDGNVANFVESETLFNHEGVSLSYVQLRGSVPLFWEQQGLQAFSPRIQLTRSRQASQPAFDRHFADLLSHYARVQSLNLLGLRDAETVLTSAYVDHVRNSEATSQAAPPEDEEEKVDLDGDERLGITNFDFHAVSRTTGGLDGVRSELKLLGPVRLKRETFSCTIVDSAGDVRRRQRGVFRTNCLDCLDRTNVIQALLSETLLEDFFDKAGRHRDSFQPFSGGAHPVWAHHRVLWAENGDSLSRIYAGTGALNSTYTRTGNAKKTFGSMLSDAAKSAGRMYINNFQDKSKQNVIDALLGNMANQRSVEVYDPLLDSVSAELDARLDEYSTRQDFTVFTGTWNLNARSPGESLLPWLCPEGMRGEPDIYALGFQEIVQLTPQQILLTDPAKLRLWEGVILDTLARRPNKKCDYVMMRSEQLVGTALVVLVKASLVSHVRQVEATARKTGMKGMSGNKGGVAIRMTVHDTSICFVTAHLAAGHSNVEERNNDYWTISKGLSFQRGRTIAGHDHVVWLGDFNYRIDLPNDRARTLSYGGDYEALYAADQLRRCRHMVFTGFEEGPLTFAPTYKYDVGTAEYDSSEKQRVPAWTDRVLYLRHPEGSGGHMLQQTTYARAELTTSDHRPVYALFQAEVRIFDREKRNAIRRELLSRGRAGQARSIAGAVASQPPPVETARPARGGGGDDTADEADDAELDLPEPSSVDALGSNWFDRDDAEYAGTDEAETIVSGVNPFLAAANSRGSENGGPTTSEASQRGHMVTTSTLPARRAPPPAPPRAAKPNFQNSARPRAQDDLFYTSAQDRPEGGPTLGEVDGDRRPPLPQRPGMSTRSTSYGGMAGLS